MATSGIRPIAGIAKIVAICLPLALAALVLSESGVRAQADPPEMVRIGGGTFTMGRDDGPADERPAHRVTLAPFLIDRLPVTNAEFAEFLNAVGGAVDSDGRRLFDWDDGDARIHKRGGAFRADPGFAHHPVVEPSWHGARAYCRWRAKRLPTEAEWERTARGAEGRPYPWGDAPPDAHRARFGVGWGETVAVGRPRDGATPEGVLNMAGNVHEWVSSLYKPYPYRAEDGREDPAAPGERVTRGGAADTGAETLRTTWRGADVSRGPRAGHHNIGFRCARPVAGG
ncbi:MAG: SUMF1/EgtB/PvdO family nonheme iron enzyme [Alphaproteobacteria bacterium]|nr:SUMF1/EgtB/PvdO family nonheme iron enzyme [Alphaproteobacteria bacterium]